MTRVIGLGLASTLALLSTLSCGDDASSPNQSVAAAGEASGGQPSAPTEGGGAGGGGAAGEGGGGAPSEGGASGQGGAGGGEPALDCALADEWEIVDDYAAAEGKATNVSSVAAGRAGRVFAVGLGRTELDELVGVVRRSLDGGATWDAAVWEDPALLPNDVALDAAGNVFVTAGSSSGSVYRSDDDGESFIKMFDIPTVPATAPCNTGFVAAGAEGVVVAGASCDDQGFVVHVSNDFGENWEPAFTFQLEPGKASRMHDVGVGADGVPYASGYGVDADDQIHWLVVRQDGTEAIISDQFQLAAGMPARAFGFSSGALLVAGSAADETGTHGIVRRMTSADVWETIDTFETRGTDVEQSGPHVVVTGQLEDPGVHAVTRVSVDDGATWTESESYRYSAEQPSFVSALTADGAGNFYGAISGRDMAGSARWILRKLACE